VSDYSYSVADRVAAEEPALPYSTRVLILISSAVACWCLVIGGIKLVWHLVKSLSQLL
jgi:hypothetical protein